VREEVDEYQHWENDRETVSYVLPSKYKDIICKTTRSILRGQRETKRVTKGEIQIDRA